MLALAATSVTPAVFGLVGVLMGALVSAAANYLVEQRRLQEERKAHERNVRAALRLLRSQLKVEYAFISSLTVDDAWSEPPQADRGRALWDQEQRPLAMALNADEFESVANAFLAAGLLELEGARRMGEQVTQEDADRLAEWGAAVERALAALDTASVRFEERKASSRH